MLEGQIVPAIQKLDPKSDEFAEIAQKVAQKTDELRKGEGRVPYPLFISSLQMQGIYPCIEVILQGPQGELFLKRREDNQNKSQLEQEAWRSKLHLPGTTIYPARKLESNLYNLLATEVVRDSESPEGALNVTRLYDSALNLGVCLYPEPERHTSALTIFFGIKISDRTILQDGYEIVTEANKEQVIEQHKPTVDRVLKGQTLFFDSRTK